jgi:uncharacterized pyridoxamine 5'-phosphate oxidase family protein
MGAQRGDDARPEPLAFLGNPLPRWVQRRVISIAPGDVRPYDESEWRDSLVIVEAGEIALECTRGGRTTFRAGDVLWLVDIPVVRMCNDGVQPAVIVAVSRRRPTRRSTMTATIPTADLDQRFSSPDVPPTPWATARDVLDAAEIFWISTVRPDGRPHVTPLMAVLLDDVLYFCTGPTEQKARNLEANPKVAMTTGASSMSEGLDLVLEGDAVRVTDIPTLAAAAERYKSKYGWTFAARDGSLHSDDAGEAYLFRVDAHTGFGFGKGEERFSQTRYRFR